MYTMRTPAEAEAESLATARVTTKRLSDMLRRERAALSEFLVALVGFDDQRLWAALGYASLFDFLHRELHLSRSAAYYRVAAVGLVRKFPSIVEALADGRLCVTALAEVAKVVTPENIREILPRFFYLSRREAKEVAAAIAPHPLPPQREVVTAVQPARVPMSSMQLIAVTDAVQPVGRPEPGAASVARGMPAMADGGSTMRTRHAEAADPARRARRRGDDRERAVALCFPQPGSRAEGVRGRLDGPLRAARTLARPARSA